MYSSAALIDIGIKLYWEPTNNIFVDRSRGRAENTLGNNCALMTGYFYYGLSERDCRPALLL